MIRLLTTGLLLTTLLTPTRFGLAQEEPAAAQPAEAASSETTETSAPEQASPGSETAEATPATESKPQNETLKQVTDKAKGMTDSIAETATKTTEDVAKSVDADPTAQKISAGILDPIYQLSEILSFPTFHWISFCIMVTGVVSFGLQLVLGKIIVLLGRGGFSLTEILSDGLGLKVSLFGLLLTTQAAAENSTFTQSAFAVLSSALAGAILGFIFYLWGQRQELEAAKGRSKGA